MAQISGAAAKASPGGGGGGGMADGSLARGRRGREGSHRRRRWAMPTRRRSRRLRDSGGLLSLLERLTGGDPDASCRWPRCRR